MNFVLLPCFQFVEFEITESLSSCIYPTNRFFLGLYDFIWLSHLYMFRYKLLLTNERNDARSIAFTLNFLSVCVLRESSLNMTRGGDEGIEGGGGGGSKNF